MPRREQIEDMLADNPDDAFLNYALAKELHAAGQTQLARDQYDRLIALHPEYVAAYFQKGQLLAESGNPETAAAALTEGISIAHRTGDDHAAAEMQDFLHGL